MGIINLRFAYPIKISNDDVTFLVSFSVTLDKMHVRICARAFNPDQISEGTRVSHQKRVDTEVCATATFKHSVEKLGWKLPS